MNPKIISYAIDAHAKVNHLYDGFPYSVHLSMVSMYAQKYINELPISVQSDVLDACWLHDTIEDCRLTYNDILNISNKNVAELVYAVTNDKGKNRNMRAGLTYYKGIKLVSFATFVKLCDRLANIKYSKETKSKMFSVYKREHDKFLTYLFSDGGIPIEYISLIKELDSLINSVFLD